MNLRRDTIQSTARPLTDHLLCVRRAGCKGCRRQNTDPGLTELPVGSFAHSPRDPFTVGRPSFPWLRGAFSFQQPTDASLFRTAALGLLERLFQNQPEMAGSLQPPLGVARGQRLMGRSPESPAPLLFAPRDALKTFKGLADTPGFPFRNRLKLPLRDSA